MQTLNSIGTTIYGSAKRKDLVGAELIEAEQAGYLPYSYQVIKWFVVLFLPVIPLGTYRVMKSKQKFWTRSWPQYSMVRVEWDWWQVIRHYLIAYSSFPLLVLAILIVGYFDKT